MSSRYHITSAGEPALCRAKEGNCPLASMHYSNPELARQAFEKEMSHKVVKTSKSERKQRAKRVQALNPDPHDVQEYFKEKYEKVDILFHKGLGGYHVLQRIVVSEQKSGTGSAIMEELVEIADRNQWKLGLTASMDLGATSKGRLEKFYRRFGFVPNKGRNKDFKTMEGMVRQPRAL